MVRHVIFNESRSETVLVTLLFSVLWDFFCFGAAFLCDDLISRRYVLFSKNCCCFLMTLPQENTVLQLGMGSHVVSRSSQGNRGQNLNSCPSH